MKNSSTLRPPQPLFWLFQVTGWGFLIFLGIVGELISTGTVTYKTGITSLIVFTGSVLITTLFRQLILKQNWLNNKLPILALLFLACSSVLACLFYGFIVLGLTLFSFPIDFSLSKVISQLLSNAILFFVWATAYATSIYIENSRQQELKNLKLLSSQKDMELNVLKNQLNPHFLFNALNSIRALVDEDPNIAKNSITQLSNVLRNTLVLGQKEFITLEEELTIVADYLQLEKVRYEERLTILEQIDPETKHLKIPPLLIQTLVENAIKHGISKRAKGGEVSITSKLIDNELQLTVTNDGYYEKGEASETGIGLTNIERRLGLIYAHHSLALSNENNQVVAKIKLPLNTN